MKALLFTAAALALVGTSVHAAPKPAAPKAAPTATEAKAFVERAEKDLAQASVYANHAEWVAETDYTVDSNYLTAKAGAEQTELSTRYATEAARFDHVKVDEVTRRKLMLLKVGLVLPAPNRPGAAQEMADIQARLATQYSTGTIQLDGKTLHLEDAEDALAKTRDPARAREIWEKWRKVAPPMKADYERLTALANEGSRGVGFKDTGALWRAGYDMPPDQFAATMDRLWGQVQPFYANLHCYVRARLNAKYGDAVQPRTGPIRADLTGNMWGQNWDNIYDLAAPAGGPGLGYDLTQQLQAKGYDAEKIVRTGQAFFTSLGFAPWPQTFWERSMITRPRDREVQCHASAWDIDNKDDIRLKVCLHVNGDDFFTAHHELGHNIYQRAYKDQPYLFENGANDGFHEAIGDFAGLNALTPGYLKQLGLIDTVPGPEADVPYLLKVAMDGVAFLPFGLLVDKWRWEVFSGQVTPDHYNDAWWALVKQYQGMVPPGPRPADAFDPGSKNHVATSVPYARYFLARVYEYQFYRAACRQAGWKGPLNRCSVFGDKQVGAKFQKMLAMGQSRPWPEALEAFTGEKDIDASALTEYFAPLNAWLTEQNKGEKCGW